MTATRTSSRQAAQKAKEAIAAAPDTKSRGGAGAKRKEAEEKGPVKKKGKTDEKAEPEPKPEEKEEKSAEKEPEPESKEGKKKGDETTEEAEGEAMDQEKESEAGGEEEQEVKDEKETEEPEGEEESAQKSSETAAADKTEAEAKTEEEKPEEKPEKDETKPTSDQEKSSQKDDSPPKVLEKGIIYFFFRPRVNVTDTQSMDEVARSFIVLRPTPGTAALDQKEGPLEAGVTCRLLMVPKKQFPKSAGQRELGFVEKAGKTVKEVEESLLSSETYATETRGEQVTPGAKPYAEGVYAITRTQNDSRLAYIVTIPAEMGPVQEEFGLEAQGGWIVQSKNPKYPGPPNAPTQNPEYPKSVEEKFQDSRWIPLEPELIDYAHAQFVLIGHTHREPGQDLKQMEAQNETRVEEHGQGDTTIYQDLGVHAKHYPTVPTTWSH